MPVQEAEGCRGHRCLRHLLLSHGLSQLSRIPPGTGQQTSGKGILPQDAISVFIPACTGTSSTSLICTGEIPTAPGHFWQPQKTAKPAAKNHEIIQKKKKLNFSFIYQLDYRCLASFFSVPPRWPEGCCCCSSVGWDHRIMEQLWWEGSLNFISFQPPALSRDTFHQTRMCWPWKKERYCKFPDKTLGIDNICGSSRINMTFLCLFLLHDMEV